MWQFYPDLRLADTFLERQTAIQHRKVTAGTLGITIIFDFGLNIQIMIIGCT